MGETKLLITDDDAGTCETLSDIFQEKGYSVTTTGTGREALIAAEQMAIDVALIDIKLPDMEGTELLKELKRKNPEMVCIIITGYADLQNAINAIEEHANGYFAKPLAIDEVTLRVKEAVEKLSLQRQLRKSEGKYRSLVEVSTDAIISHNEERKIIQWNKAASNIFGYSKEEVLGEPFDIIIPEQHKRSYVEDIKDFITEAGENKLIGKTNELEAVRKDGSVVPVELSLSAVKQDRSWIFTAIVRDITKRKRAEDILHKSEKQYRRLVETINEGLGVINEETSLTYANNKFCDMWGYSLEEIVGRPLTEFLDDEDLGIFNKQMEILKKGKKSPYEIKWTVKDGRKLQTILSPQIIFDSDGNIEGYLAVLTDITKRVRAEKRLKASEERYRDLFENANDLIYSVAPDGRLLYANRAWQETLGYNEEEITGLSLIDIIHPDSRTHCMEIFRRLISGEKVDRIEVMIVARDGKKITVEGSANCRFVKGKPVSTQGIFSNITEYKLLEEQLRLSQKLEAVGRLAGGVAHDFNNMLTVINGYSEYLMSMLKKSDSTYKILEEIIQAGKRAASLTHQLLAFSRKQILQPQVLDLNTVVANIEKMLRRLIGEDIDLTLIPNPAQGSVKIDPTQIDQIIMNLAINARDAMPEGGKLTIETANIELDEVYAKEHVAVKPGPYIILTVSDSGIGMDSETQSHIFEPFFTTKEECKGTGLGLSTVYGIVKQSGGNIWVYSEPGQGTTFKIYLPRVVEAVESVQGVEAPAETLQGKEIILLVEDEEMVRDLARLALVKNGYTVLEAPDGVEALNICKQHQGPIHLMITDVVMPRMGGRKAAERLAPSHPDMKVLYISGYTDNAIVHHGVLGPETHFLQKPFTPAILLRKVREVLEGP